jgi:ankyrin repeat protein
MRYTRTLSLVLSLMVVGAVRPVPPIIEAARARDWEAVRMLVEQGTDVTVRAPDGATALHWTSYWDAVDATRLLLRAGADADAANELGATPLWIAAQNGSAATVQALLAAGADANATLLSGESPLMTAARTGAPEVMELLLEAGADVEARGPRGQTALMWAASQRHPEAVRVLLAHDADVRARSDTWSQVMAFPPHSDPANQQDVPHGNYTALMFAVRVGDVASARLLLDAGAVADDEDAWGVSAVTLAAHAGFGDLLEVLLDSGADPDAAGAGFSALHMAIMRRDADMVRVLLDHGAGADARVANWTPTRRASADWSIHPAMIGATPFWLAARLSEPDVMRLLVEHGADPLFVHEASYVGAAGTFGAEWKAESTTALMAAAGMGGPRNMGGYLDPDPATLAALRLDAVMLAVQLGVDPAAVDLDGRTAAEATRDPAVSEFLSGVVVGR